MVIIDTLINTLLGGLTLDPAGMHCPSWGDAFVSSFLQFLRLGLGLGSVIGLGFKVRVRGSGSGSIT